MTAARIENDHDLHENVNDNNDTTENASPTPLPKFQLFIVMLIQFSEPITATVIYPFVNQFVRETGITKGDEKMTGYYAGIIESVFFFSESFTVVQWGYLSDRYGRRPVLLCAPLGLAIAILGFGMSKTFCPLVVFRCFQGIFNGNIGVSKSVIVEITDSTNRGDAFAFIPLMWSVGITTAPTIGGVLSNPVTRWPDSFGRIDYLKEHPYFLPCLASGFLAFLTFVISLFGLKESLPSIVAKEKQRNLQERTSNDIVEETTLLIDHRAETGYSSTESSSLSEQIKSNNRIDNSNSTFRIIFKSPIRMIFLSCIFLTFLDMCNTVLIPLMYSTPVAMGGLGLDPFQIGVSLGTFGLINSVIQAKFLGKLIRKYGARRMFRMSFACFSVFFVNFLMTSFFVRRVGRVDGFVVACIILHLSFMSTTYIAYGSLQVFLVENVPENGPMATINGVAQMLSSGARSFAPSFASSLFSVSLQRQLAGGNLVYLVLLAITFGAILFNVNLPEKQAKRHVL